MLIAGSFGENSSSPRSTSFAERARASALEQVGGAEDFDIGAFAAAEGLESDGAESRFAEGAGEERGGEGFADAGVGAGEEEVHAAVSTFEKCSIFRYG